jgi:transcriptional regulator with XRE-family HTH domain
MHIGEKIKLLREQIGLTQAQLAQKAGIGQPYISKLESQVIKVPSVDTLVRLAMVLEADIRELSAGTTYGDESKRQARPGIGFCPTVTCPGRDMDAPFVTPLQDEEGEPINFCVHCGSGLVRNCPDCSRKFKQFYRFCPGCGRRLYPAQQESMDEDDGEPMDDDDVPIDEDDVPF